MKSWMGQIGRFGMVGVTAVAIDFICYRGFLFLGLPVGLSKAMSFILGAIFGYIANRNWTFATRTTRFSIPLFTMLYLVTLGLNVGINDMVIRNLGRGEIGVMIGFLTATGVSATANFLGLKFLVFAQTRQ